MNIPVKAVGFVAVILSLVAFSLKSASEGKQKTMEDEIVRMERELAAATERRDATVFERLMAEDFIGVDHLGREVTRAEILARLNVTGYELESLKHENIRVRLFGDCAIATARTVLRGRYQGQDVSGEFPYLRVWLRRAGRWQAVATQSTMIPRK